MRYHLYKHIDNKQGYLLRDDCDILLWRCYVKLFENDISWMFCEDFVSEWKILAAKE